MNLTGTDGQGPVMPGRGSASHTNETRGLYRRYCYLGGLLPLRDRKYLDSAIQLTDLCARVANSTVTKLAPALWTMTGNRTETLKLIQIIDDFYSGAFDFK